MSTIHITENHTGKMSGMTSINTSSLHNDYCNVERSNDNICSYCYAKKLESIYPSMKNAFYKNHLLLSNIVLPKKDLPKIKSKYCRFSAFGELINDIHVKNIINICNYNPKTTFVLWTKRLELIINIEKPKNLKIIYSNPRIDNPITDNNIINCDGIFNVVKDKYHDRINCRDKCIDCQKCYVPKNVGIIYEKLK